MRRAKYRIVSTNRAKDLLIQDVGPWDLHPTVTNDAEAVVQELHQQGRLGPGWKLICIDSEGDLAELKHEGGRFTGFRCITIGGRP